MAISLANGAYTNLKRALKILSRGIAKYKLRRALLAYCAKKAIAQDAALATDKPIWRTIGGEEDGDRRRNGKILKGGTPDMKGKTFKEAFPDKANEQRKQKAAKAKALTLDQIKAIYAKLNGVQQQSPVTLATTQPNNQQTSSNSNTTTPQKTTGRAAPKDRLDQLTHAQIDAKFASKTDELIEKLTHTVKPQSQGSKQVFQPAQIGGDKAKSIQSIAPRYHSPDINVRH